MGSQALLVFPSSGRQGNKDAVGRRAMASPEIADIVREVPVMQMPACWRYGPCVEIDAVCRDDHVGACRDPVPRRSGGWVSVSAGQHPDRHRFHRQQCDSGLHELDNHGEAATVNEPQASDKGRPGRQLGRLQD